MLSYRDLQERLGAEIMLTSDIFRLKSYRNLSHVERWTGREYIPCGKGVQLLVTYFGLHLMRLLSVCLVLTLLDRNKCGAKLVW